MLTKLKVKLTLINMTFVSVVLLILFAIICLNSYHTARDEVKYALDLALTEAIEDIDIQQEIGEGESSGAESAGDTEYAEEHGIRAINVATVVVLIQEKDGHLETTLLEDQSDDDVVMSEEALETAAADAYASSESHGRLPEQNLFFMKREGSRGMKVAFADTTFYDEEVRESIFNAVMLFTMGVTIMLVISVVLSNIVVEPVRKAWEQQRQFIADASHELKTPLTVILTNNEILLSDMDKSNEKQRKWVENTQAEAEHMKHLIDDLLFLARSDEAAEEGRTAVMSNLLFSDLVTDVTLQFEPILFEAGKILSTDIENDIYMECDGTQMKQLLYILLDNAVKYAGDHGTIYVSLEMQGIRPCLTVANTGEVIDSSDIEHMFDRFYRTDKARTQEGGYGLGLSIAKTIVENHGGRLWAESGRLGDMDALDKKDLPEEITGVAITALFAGNVKH